MREYQVVHLIDCARCGERAFENLPTIGHCTSCNYSPEADDGEWSDVAAIPLWALEAIGELASQPRMKPKNPEPGRIRELDSVPAQS